MEYLVIGGILVAMVILIWVFKGNHETKAEQQENENARKRASAAESFREQYEAQLPTTNQLQNFRRSPPAAPRSRSIRPSPPPAPPMRKLGGNSSAFSAGYGSSSPAPVRDPSMDVLTTVLLVDALTPDSVPEAKIPYVDAPYNHGTPECKPEPESQTRDSGCYDSSLRDTTDYGTKSNDSGWSSNDNSDSGWSSSDSSSSSSSFD